ncbi:DUF7619 domain-containing protein [Flavobacterium wongokense]|uniref:DUF7619 domain-containing protein n=1 Tax=Flavobacterium wongokense TaxID=2910674 RepID=UPI001F1AF522|nr:T9SS type A sorting domain-containing protein [Flavobacterium sp. WG47]MCF6133341.1 T9SS type A sorting domain-containing protein [Flavobacterium sp. WG47]
MKNSIFLLFALFSFSLSNAQIVNIPDANFKTALLNYPGIDTNTDGEIQVSEALQVSYLHLTAFGINNGLPNISSQTANLTGLEMFTNLTMLYIDGLSITNFNFPTLTNLMILEFRSNLALANVNVLPLTNLIYFRCDQSSITSLDLSTLTQLERLNCEFDSLSSLNLSNNPHLQMLACSHNQISQLNLSNLTELYFLGADNNNLTTLDLTNNHLLQYLYCSYNQLTDLVNIDAPGLHTIECAYNQLTSLDFSHTRILVPYGGTSQIYIYGNPALNFINLKTGYPFTDGSIIIEHPVQYICTDDYNIPYVANQLQSPIFSGTNIGTYCDFVPGGNYNTISGTFNYDADGNGCDFEDTKTATNLDFPFENLFITLSGPILNGTYSNTDGDYSFFATQGTFTITPTPIPYFTISPPSASVSFPDSNNNSQIQNFCISPNGVHNDVDIVILAIQNARPGFDTRYQLVYKNKGNQTMSGTINLSFDDAILDFVSATPALNNQSTNNLNWTYSNLMPFESRTIEFKLHLNGPTDTPAVNLDDVLHFTATINPIPGDETPEDNVFHLTQTVRGSMDPNDKTCLEGTTITPDMVGDYLNYVIRFQNSGTYYAENVVVKDVIDTSKFDISSLQLISSSHPHTTRITGNKVEFIFENINLPAEMDNEPGSHGFVAFKIKTKSNLVLGNQVQNTADIYFDFNAPIVTNTASTTVALLNVNETEANGVAINPIPVKDILQIRALESISSVEIFDIQGRLLQIKTADDLSTTVDFTGEPKGVYLVKVYTSKGMKIQKIIKE